MQAAMNVLDGLGIQSALAFRVVKTLDHDRLQRGQFDVAESWGDVTPDDHFIVGRSGWLHIAEEIPVPKCEAIARRSCCCLPDSRRDQRSK